MNPIPLSRYVVRPRPISGESILGYIYRYMSANGHVMRQNEYYQIAKKIFMAKSISQFEANFEILSLAIGDDILLDPIFWRDYKYLNFGISERLMNFTTTNVWYCSRCLSEDEYHRSPWQIFGIRSCPFHEILLTRSCPECKKGLAWASLLPNWRCRCGCKLTDHTANVREVDWEIRIKDLIQYSAPHLRPSAKCVQNFRSLMFDQTQVVNLVVTKDLVDNLRNYDIKYNQKVGSRLAFQFVRYLYFWQRKEVGYRRKKVIDLTFLMFRRGIPKYTSKKIDRSQSVAFCIYQCDNFSIYFLESITDTACAALMDYCCFWWNRNRYKLKILEEPERESRSHVPRLTIAENSENKNNQIFALLENLLNAMILGYDIDDLEVFKPHLIIPESLTLPSSTNFLIRLIDYLMDCTEERLEKWTQYLKDDLKRLESEFEFTHFGIFP